MPLYGLHSSRLLAPRSLGGRILPTTAYVTGDRRASITVTTTFTAGGTASDCLDGNTGGIGPFVNSGPSAGNQWRFDFGAGVAMLVDEAKLYMEDSRDEGLWKWRGSNDLSSFTDIGGNHSVSGATLTHTMTELNGNTIGYRYYCFEYVSGNAAGQPRWQEFEFKQAAM